MPAMPEVRAVPPTGVSLLSFAIYNTLTPPSFLRERKTQRRMARTVRKGSEVDVWRKALALAISIHSADDRNAIRKADDLFDEIR